jgi:transposase
VDTSGVRRMSEGEAVTVRTRRRWPVDEKLRIVLETLEPGVSVPVVARRHSVNANQLFIWRGQYQRGELRANSADEREVKLLPVRVEPPAASEPAARGKEVSDAEPGGCMEIQFPGGARVKVRGAVDEKVLRALVRELSRPC